MNVRDAQSDIRTILTAENNSRSIIQTHSMSSVYLAGPITGLNYSGATDWRREAESSLFPIKALDPMRGKNYLLNETYLADTYSDEVLSTQRAIMVRDFFDCQRCDLIFVNLLGAQRVSIGTSMEIAWGYAQHKPIVAVIEEHGNVHDHGMIREALGWRVTSLKAGLDLVKSILL